MRGNGQTYGVSLCRGLLALVVTSLAASGTAQAESAIDSIQKAPIVADGNVRERASDFVINLNVSSDPAEPGVSLELGDEVRVTLPDGFVVSQFTAVSADGRVIAGYGNDPTTWGSPFESFLVHLAGVADVPRSAPAGGLTLGANYPNPFNPTTSIELSLAADGEVTLEILDARGRLVRVLHAGGLAAGRHVLRWDGCDERGRPLGSGVYLATARDRTGSTASRRMTLVK